MRIRKIYQDDIKVSNMSKVKVRITGNTQVVQFTAGNNKKCSVVNLSKDTYLNKITGEIKHKKKSESRYQSPKSVRKSINKLMDLIRCNATEPAKCKWLTVTYAETMTDGKQAFLDAKLFLRKLRRHLNKQAEITTGQKSFKYITVAEPQGESHGNSWHLHILLIFDDTAPFIENEIITSLWCHGLTSANEVFDGDGLALYFKVHLSDVEYENNNDNVGDTDNEDKPATVKKNVNGVSKQFIKGERLKYYPSGMNLYSSSRGLKKPEVEEMTNAEAMDVVSDSKLVYRETYSIGDKGNGNLVDKRYYRKKDKINKKH